MAAELHRLQAGALIMSKNSPVAPEECTAALSGALGQVRSVDDLLQLSASQLAQYNERHSQVLAQLCSLVHRFGPQTSKRRELREGDVRVSTVCGSTEALPGMIDGSAEYAQFHHPHGGLAGSRV